MNALYKHYFINYQKWTNLTLQKLLQLKKNDLKKIMIIFMREYYIIF